MLGGIGIFGFKMFKKAKKMIWFGVTFNFMKLNCVNKVNFIFDKMMKKLKKRNQAVGFRFMISFYKNKIQLLIKLNFYSNLFKLFTLLTPSLNLFHSLGVIAILKTKTFLFVSPSSYYRLCPLSSINLPFFILLRALRSNLPINFV